MAKSKEEVKVTPSVEPEVEEAVPTTAVPEVNADGFNVAPAVD